VLLRRSRKSWLREKIQELRQDFTALSPAWPGLLSTSTLQEASHIQKLLTDSVGENLSKLRSTPEDFYLTPAWQEARSFLEAKADLASAFVAVESRQSPRLLSQLDSGLGLGRLILALVWTFTWYGVPDLNQGMEMGFDGTCFDESGDGRSSIQMHPDAQIKVASTLLENCNHTSKQLPDRGFWHQDMFSGGPMRLGAAVASAHGEAGMRSELMQASGPHWCEDRILERKNPIFRTAKALSRIRRSCPALSSSHDLQAKLIEGEPEQLAYWKLAESEPRAMLVLLNFAKDPSTMDFKFSLPPIEVSSLKDGQRFMNLLNPGQVAIVVAKGNDSYFFVPALDRPPRASIFALEEEVAPDEDPDWLVCTAVSLPSLPQDPCQSGSSLGWWLTDKHLPASWATCSAVILWILLVLVPLVRRSSSSICIGIVSQVCAPLPLEADGNLESALPTDEAPKRHVLCADLEHSIPSRGIEVTFGRVGKAFGRVLHEHPPGKLSLVHPMFKDCDYGKLDFYSELSLLVDGKTQVVEVLIMEEEEVGGTCRVRYLLRHWLFSERPSEDLHAPAMNKLRVLRFYSLWNQAVAAMLNMLDPDVYRCVDYHTALAPLYLEAEARVPVILVLRDASQMGVIESDLVSDRFWKTVPALRRLSLIFNLQVRILRKYCVFEGRFNMLKAGVAYIHEAQGGHGACTVSAHPDLRIEHVLFSGLQVTCLNPLQQGHGLAQEVLRTMRVQSKTALQRHCRLEEDPEAKILVFINWAKHVDVVALATEILFSNKAVQVVLAGPVEDACGLWAQDSVASIAQQFRGRIFLNTEFCSLPEDLLRGADFVMPCPLELYADVDFAMLGVPTIGCAAGRLGQMPGVYYCQQNSSSNEMLASAIFCAVQQSLQMSEHTYWQLAVAGTQVLCSATIWKEKMLEAYTRAQRSFRHKACKSSRHGHLWTGSSVSQEDLQRAIAPRRSSSLRPISSTAALVHQMQVLDIDEDAEFLTQPVSETRAHTLMKAVAATPHGTIRTDATALHKDISQAAERLKEKNAITRWLMKQFACGLCLRIHTVIGLCYVFVPMGELALKTVEVKLQEGSLAIEVQWSIYFAGAALGCCLWLVLSAGIPPNLLMAISQAINLIVFVLMPSMASGVFESDLSYTFYLVVSGAQSSSRLLFLIWNFSEDEQGFEVAIWRLGLLEGLRAGLAWLAVTLSLAGMDYVNKQAVFLVSFITLILLCKAPDSYSSRVLPRTGLGAVLCRPSFLLLLTSEVLCALSSYGAQDITHWFSLNGWEPSEVRGFALLAAGLLPLALASTSSCLRRISVWGPWALRDFACILPPAPLLRVLALYDLGHRKYRSEVFVAAMMLSVAMELTRFVAVWSAIMTVLASRCYALKGCYLCLCSVMVATAVSPWLAQWQSKMLCASSPFDPLVTLEPSFDGVGLGESTAWSVLPLALLSYVFQLLALPGFNKDVPSFKENSSYACGSTSWKQVPVGEVNRLRSQAHCAEKLWQAEVSQFRLESKAEAEVSPFRLESKAEVEVQSEDDVENDDVASEHESLKFPSLTSHEHDKDTATKAEEVRISVSLKDEVPEVRDDGEQLEILLKLPTDEVEIEVECSAAKSSVE